MTALADLASWRLRRRVRARLRDGWKPTCGPGGDWFWYRGDQEEDMSSGEAETVRDDLAPWRRP